MRKLTLFFDYACPYCLRAFDLLARLIPEYLDIHILWTPCEAHPRPEKHGLHSDLLIQGMYFAQAQGLDLWVYHKRMFQAALVDKVNIEDLHVLASCMRDLLPEEAFVSALKENRYEAQVLANNRLAYEESGVWAVPAFRMEGQRLDAAEGMDITEKQLAAFLSGDTGFRP